MAETLNRIVMRIISWNVNGIGRRYKELMQLAEEYQPDIIFLQKIKNMQGNANFPIEGYRQLWWVGDSAMNSGVAAYCKESIGLEHIVTPELSEGGHFQMFVIDGICICNAYVPYSNTSIPESVDIRKCWDKELHDTITRVSKDMPVMIFGDLNIVHTEYDQNDDEKLVQNKGCFFDWERDNFYKLLSDARLADSFRKLHPDEKKFSYFHEILGKMFKLGWRIDYALVSDSLMPDVVSSDILTDFGSAQSVPIILDLNKTIGLSEKYFGEVVFSKEERKIAKEILKKGILSYHQNWQNGIAALIQSPYADNENPFDRSMEITQRSKDFYKEAMRLENLYDKTMLASGIAMFLADGNLKEDDLKDLPIETQRYLLYKAEKMRD